VEIRPKNASALKNRRKRDKSSAWWRTGGRHRVSETRTEDRLGRVEEDVREIKTTLAGLVPLINRIDERLNTGLPHPATKAELADLRTELLTALAHKPGRGYLWGVMAAMVGAQAVAVAAAALVFSIVQARLQPPAPAHASI